MIKNKIDTIIWFIKNPKYIPHIFQILKRNNNSQLENTRLESTNWCKQNCVGQEEALIRLFGKKTFNSLDVLYSEEIKKSEKKFRAR